MKALLDFLVLILFFGIYYITKDIFMATAVAIVGGVVQVIICWIKYKKLHGMQMLNLLIILVFGGLTLILHDENWIKWKPTVLYWTFATVLCGGLLVKRNFLQRLFGQEIQLPTLIWNRLTSAWILFFIFLGILNLWVAFTFDIDQWVTFKVFGATGLIVMFIILQGIYLYQYFPKDEVNGRK
ncbi:MAG: septation protein A [Neisseriaceae bacterium]|nr:MAG: septation protein A [Neisseriaceae bacterium]